MRHEADLNSRFLDPGSLLSNFRQFRGAAAGHGRRLFIGDNLLALKMNFETELNPFLWIAGVGVASLVAFQGAKYLSDQGALSGTAPRNTSVNVYWGPWSYPWYHYHPHHPTYWDDREEEENSSQGKAQFAGGLSWLTDNNSVQDQNTNYYTLTLATGYEERVALGGNVNFYDIKIPSVNLKGYGAGVDLGLLLRPVDQLAFGAVAKEILTTDIHFENGTNLTYRMSINTGIAITPIDELTLAADMQNVFRQANKPQTYHYGAEFRPFPGLALRAGLNDGSKTAGASVMINQVILDYAYLGGSFNRTQIVGLTWRL